MKNESFDGKHVAITGGGTGIGRGTAKRFAEGGATLTLIARNRERLLETGEMVEALGAPTPTSLACDISDRDQVERTLDEAVEANGPIHGFVANAGIGGTNSPGPDDSFEEVIRTNVIGTYWTVRGAQARLADGPELRHIVVVSSMLAKMGAPGYSALATSKSALLALVRVMAAELAPSGVQVNAICPGWVNTILADEGIDLLMKETGITDRDQAVAEAMKGVPIGFMNEPEEIGGTIAWLMSPDARAITGQSIDQNGGVVMPA